MALMSREMRSRQFAAYMASFFEITEGNSRFFSAGKTAEEEGKCREIATPTKTRRRVPGKHIECSKVDSVEIRERNRLGASTSWALRHHRHSDLGAFRKQEAAGGAG